MQYLFEDADFSLYRIKELIAEGERNAENAIAKKGVEIIWHEIKVSSIIYLHREIYRGSRCFYGL